MEKAVQGQHPFKPQVDLSHFYVVTPISNQWLWKRRYELYWPFKEMVEAAGVKLVTIEHALADRPFMVTSATDPMNIQVRGVDEVWYKENLLNIAFGHITRTIDPKASKIAWVDADCFAMTSPREWFERTAIMLDHYQFVQMWKHLINFGPQNEVIGEPQLSFMASYEAMDFVTPKGAYKNQVKLATDYTGKVAKKKIEGKEIPQQLGRPGLAWAANVDALNHVGGLLDLCILGSGDWHMAHALVGAMTEQSTLVGTIPGHGSQEFKNPAYTHYLLSWQEKCERWIKRDVGCVDVTVGHWWHGKYKDRKYGSRGKILVENKFNPYTDCKYDSQWQIQLETWEPRQIRMRDQLRAYFKARSEDSIDL